VLTFNGGRSVVVIKITSKYNASVIDCDRPVLLILHTNYQANLTEVSTAMRLFFIVILMCSITSGSKILFVVFPSSKSHLGSMLPFAEA
jgi:hypothetical protein